MDITDMYAYYNNFKEGDGTELFKHMDNFPMDGNNAF